MSVTEWQSLIIGERGSLGCSDWAFICFLLFLRMQNSSCNATGLTTKPSIHYFNLFQLFPVFAWFALFLSGISILVAWAVHSLRVKVRLHQLWYDHHYRLRFALSLALIVNRVLAFLLVILNYHMLSLEYSLGYTLQVYAEHCQSPSTSFHDGLYPEQRIFRVFWACCHALFQPTLYVMMVLMLFLMMDRYQRVQLILPGSLRHVLIRILMMLYSLALLHVFVASVFDFVIPTLDSSGLFRANSLVQAIMASRLLVERIGVISGMLMYYFLTIHLILNSIRGVCFTWTAIKTVIKEKMRRDYRPDYNVGKSSSFVFASTPSQHNNATNEILSMGSIAPTQLVTNNLPAGGCSASPSPPPLLNNKMWAALKMLLYLFIIILVDLAVLTGMVIGNIYVVLAPGFKWDDVVVFSTSWIVVHVYLVYELLDMFVKDLKNAKRNTRKMQSIKWLRPCC